jgi:AcrR family transcriptional regulator
MYTSDESSVRERLLAGALQCLQEKGYAEATARDVTEASGCNLRSIGYHFGSTRMLFLSAISLNFRRWLEPLIAVAGDEQASPAERLRSGMERFAAALPENGPMLRAWLEAVVLAGHDDELREVLARNQTEFREALQETLAEGGVDRAPEAAAAIISVCDGLIVRFLLHGEAGRPEDAALAASRAFALLG